MTKSKYDKKKFDEFQKSFVERNRKREKQMEKDDIEKTDKMEEAVDKYSYENPNKMDVEKAEETKRRLRKNYEENKRFKNLRNYFNE